MILFKYGKLRQEAGQDRGGSSVRAGDWIRKLTVLAKRLHYLYLALTLKFSIIYYTHTYHMFPSSELCFFYEQ